MQLNLFVPFLHNLGGHSFAKIENKNSQSRHLSHFWVIYLWTYELVFLDNLIYILILFQGINLRQDLRGNQRIIMGNQTLVLQSLGRNASGSYYCVATNSEGFTLSNAVHLNVKCKFINAIFRINYNWILAQKRIIFFCIITQTLIWGILWTYIMRYNIIRL